jgi:uncharacterized protein (TIGR00730 family)
MTSIKKVCVFCASSPGIDKIYFRDAEELGRIFVDNKIHVVYGGGSVGLMGCLADTIMAGNGQISGIIPRFMKEMNWAHQSIAEMIEVESMHERKNLMIRDVDAVVALPGGVGTLEELMEVITLKQLGQFFAPIIILNTGGFYNHLDEFLHKMIEQRFMREMHKEIWQLVDSPAKILPAIFNSKPWNGNAIKFAAVDE